MKNGTAPDKILSLLAFRFMLKRTVSEGHPRTGWAIGSGWTLDGFSRSLGHCVFGRYGR